eukprot:GHVR01009947.1.p1 GENE.GHVR01009947.1~~GHVR01009947.1.p1  ORF type:complete len:105 (+),score=0.15 GHVR01009947.1:255-569(+)
MRELKTMTCRENIALPLTILTYTITSVSLILTNKFLFDISNYPTFITGLQAFIGVIFFLIIGTMADTFESLNFMKYGFPRPKITLLGLRIAFIPTIFYGTPLYM